MEFRAEANVLHLVHALGFVWLGGVVVPFSPQIRGIVGHGISDLLLLPLEYRGSLSIHLVQLLQQLVALLSLLLVELLDIVLHLVHTVQLQSLGVDWVDEFVHPVEEDADALLDLLVAHQIGEVFVGVVAVVQFSRVLGALLLLLLFLFEPLNEAVLLVNAVMYAIYPVQVKQCVRVLL